MLRCAFDAAIDLAADRRLLIQQHDARLLFSQQRRCGEAGGTGADHHDIRRLVHNTPRAPR